MWERILTAIKSIDWPRVRTVAIAAFVLAIGYVLKILKLIFWVSLITFGSFLYLTITTLFQSGKSKK